MSTDIRSLPASLRRAASVTPLILAMLLGAQPAQAATDLREYNVELVVFENRDADPNREFSPIDLKVQIPEQAVDFDNEGDRRDARQQGFVPLETGQGGLRELVNRLNRSSRYRVVLYRAWRQPGLPFETAIPVHIHGGNNYTGRYPSLPSAFPAQSELTFSPAAQAPSVQPQRLEEIDGTVTVSLQRYLHMSADLVFREPRTAPMPPKEMETEPQVGTPESETQATTETSPVGTVPAAWQPALIPGQPYLQPHHLRERRRMRSREIHYFDNPRFGVITLITPHEPEGRPEN